MAAGDASGTWLSKAGPLVKPELKQRRRPPHAMDVRQRDGTPRHALAGGPPAHHLARAHYVENDIHQNRLHETQTVKPNVLPYPDVLLRQRDNVFSEPAADKPARSFRRRLE